MQAEISSATVKRLIDTSPVAMVLSSPALNDCPIVHANDAFLELTLYERAQILGRNCRMLQGPATEQPARLQLRAAVAQREGAAVAITNYRRDGTVFRNFVFLHPIFDRAGQLQFILGSQYEISAPKPRISLLEHAELIDRSIEVARPALERDAALSLAPSPVANIVRAHRFQERNRS